MANWATLKAAIADVIKANGNQEITGAILQNALNNIVTSVGEYAAFAGIANTTTNPGTPDGPVFYLAFENGTYSNFNGITLKSEVAILLLENNSWVKKETQIAKMSHSPLKRDYISGDITINDNKIELTESSSTEYVKLDCTNTPCIIINERIDFTTHNGIYWVDENSNIIKAFYTTDNNSNITIESNVVLYRPINAKYIYIKKESNSNFNFSIPVIFDTIYPECFNTYSNFYNYDNFKKGEFTFAPTKGNILQYSYSSGYASLLIPFKNGESIILDGIIGGWNARAYVLLDSEYRAISFANGGVSLNNIEITAPSNCKYILIQSNITSNKKISVVRKHTEKINILSISNSYGCDGLSFVPSILQSIGINNIECAVAYHAAANLQGHVENIGTNWYTYYYTADGVWTQEDNKSLEYILASRKWDYIVFQQGSLESGKYSTYQPYLEKLMKYVFGKISYPTVCAFNITQPYAIGFSALGAYGNSQEQMYNSILEAAEKVKNEYGINTTINVAKAVQLARGTELNNYGNYSEGQLSYDGTHLDGGIGRLLAGYTWILALLKNRLNTDIYSSNFLPSKSKNLSLPDDNRGDWVDVTSDMAYIAKRCATVALSGKSDSV